MPTTRDAQGFLTLGGVRLADVASDPRVGTPAYVYDLDGIEAEARALDAAFDGAPHLVAYAVKANAAGPVVRALAAVGCGADVVSAGEMLVALGCGVAPDRIVFSGVGKTDDEIDRAIGARIGAIQVESIEELERVEARAREAKSRARVAIRINPGLDKDATGSHAHIATGHDEAKFGVAMGDVATAVVRALEGAHVELVGLASHVGSQLTSTDVYVAGARSLFGVARIAREQGARSLAFVDTGGGFGIDYGDGCAAKPADFVKAARAEMTKAQLGDLALHVEPGRALVGAHGVLLASVVREKTTPHTASLGVQRPTRAWLVIDAGMNDLIRPALYQARHRIVNVVSTIALQKRAPSYPHAHRVVGPVCESSDDFGEHEGLLFAKHVAILDAGGYGYSMASRYNGRALPAEAFVRGGRIVGVTSRKGIEDWAAERIAVGEERG